MFSVPLSRMAGSVGDFRACRTVLSSVNGFRFGVGEGVLGNF